MAAPRTTAKTTAQPKPEIDPDAYYDVAVTTPFVFERVRFGPLASVEVSGAMLARLLDGENAPLVGARTPKA